jgi:ornithine cyclodeaminase/alanine dehydrogenase-like protein (mu-crystallin family)
VRRLTPMRALIAALKNAFVHGAASPPRQHYDLPGHGTLLLMPAWRGEVTTGIKVVTIYSRSEPSVQATYLLLEGRSGRLRAILDGTMITKRRTAAASALAADMLARPEAHRLLVLGTGALVPHLVEAYCAVRPIHEVSIWGRDHDKARACAAAIECRGLSVQAVTDRRQALGRADIISAATLSTTALVTGAELNPGTHVDLIGAFKPEMCEADPTSFARARVFVDTRAGALSEAGDLLQAIAADALTADRIEADLADLCAGRHRGRGEDAQAITLFKAVGTAIEDLAVAETVCRAWMLERRHA